MVENTDIENIRHISKKKWSGFSIYYGFDRFVIKSKSPENYFTIFISLQLILSLYKYSQDKNGLDLISIVLYILFFILIILAQIFGKKTSNLIELNFKKKTLTVESKSWIRRIFKKEITAKTTEIDSIDTTILKNATRIFITIKEKEFMLMDVRNRKGDNSITLDSKTDGECVAECLDNILIKKEN